MLNLKKKNFLKANLVKGSALSFIMLSSFAVHSGAINLAQASLDNENISTNAGVTYVDVETNTDLDQWDVNAALAHEYAFYRAKQDADKIGEDLENFASKLHVKTSSELKESIQKVENFVSDHITVPTLQSGLWPVALPVEPPPGINVKELPESEFIPGISAAAHNYMEVFNNELEYKKKQAVDNLTKNHNE